MSGSQHSRPINQTEPGTNPGRRRFAAQPSGADANCKIYPESFRSETQLRQVRHSVQDALALVFRRPAPAGLAA